MNGFEAAIKNALERADRTNPEVRARIYQSARQALENGIRKQGLNDPSRVAAQRRWLEQLIATIEAQEEQTVAALRPERSEPQLSPHVQSTANRQSHERREPGFFDTGPEDESDDDDEGRYADDDDLRADRTSRVPDGEIPGERIASPSGPDLALTRHEQRVRRPRRRRGVFARAFIYFILFISVVMGGAWLYVSGALLSPAQRDTSVPNPPPRVEAEDFAEGTDTPAFDPQGGFSGDWVEIFTPSSAPRLRVGSAARMEQTTTASGPAIRISSSTAGEQGEVRLDVPVDILSQMAGKTSTIALTMQSASAQSASVSVQCRFGTLGTCERHRFTAAQEKFDALFKVTLPRGLTPSTPGALLINTGLGTGGRSIDLYSVRVLPGE